MTHSVLSNDTLLSPDGVGAQTADVSAQAPGDGALLNAIPLDGGNPADEALTGDAEEVADPAGQEGLLEPEPVAVDPDLVPERPEDYALNLDENLGDADPALNARLHAAGFNNAQAQLVYDLAGEIIPTMVAQVQQAGQRATDRAALVAEFGGVESWKALAPKIEKWGRENLPDDAFDAMCQTASGVRAIHRLMTGGSETGLGNVGASDAQSDTRSDIQRKMNDPRYWRDRDPVLIAEVQAAFARMRR